VGQPEVQGRVVGGDEEPDGYLGVFTSEQGQQLRQEAFAGQPATVEGFDVDPGLIRGKSREKTPHEVVVPGIALMVGGQKQDGRGGVAVRVRKGR
jgi:hypothetical protein